VSMNRASPPREAHAAATSCAHHSSPCPTTKSVNCSVSMPAAEQQQYTHLQQANRTLPVIGTCKVQVCFFFHETMTALQLKSSLDSR